MKKALIYLSITALINIVFRLISRFSAPFSEWYAVNIYPLKVGFWGRITGVFPFAVVEILLYILILSFIAGAVYLIIRLVKGRGRRLKILLNATVALSCAVSTMLMIFLFSCEINYQRLPFSHHSGLKLELYAREDLRGVLLEVIDELHRIVPNIETGEQGQFVFKKTALNRPARDAMNRLGELYPALDTYYPRPKPVLLSRQILSPMQVAGIFSPFTFEALYNGDMPDSSKPFTALHELSHLNGFMREDEANFIAFLACRESGDADLMYSGYLNALGYLLGAYDGDDFFDIYLSVPEQVLVQYRYNSEYWRSFLEAPGGAAIAAVSTAVNDTYLIIQGQEDGVKSYGRVVDLLIADYLHRNT